MPINSKSIRIFVLAAAACLLVIVTNRNAIALSACPQIISQCGCSINSNGVFTTSGSLNSLSLTDDCIDISAEGAVLVLFGDITGPGGAVSKVGIHILKSASNAFVSGRSAPGFGGGHFSVTGFETGIQIDADNVEVDQLDSSGNTVDGVIFNATSGSDYDDSKANDNGGVGVLITGGSGNIFSDGTADGDGIGFEVLHGANNRVTDGDASNNQGYGYWLAQSKGNHIKDSGFNNNRATGSYIGCFAEGGPTGSNCPPGIRNSKFNRVIASGGSGNSGAGVAIDRRDSFNVMDENGASSNSLDDAVDMNRKCDHNIWMENGFKTTSRKCIQ